MELAVIQTGLELQYAPALPLEWLGFQTQTSIPGFKKRFSECFRYWHTERTCGGTLVLYGVGSIPVKSATAVAQHCLGTLWLLKNAFQNANILRIILKAIKQQQMDSLFIDLGWLFQSGFICGSECFIGTLETYWAPPSTLLEGGGEPMGRVGSAAGAGGPAG